MRGRRGRAPAVIVLATIAYCADFGLANPEYLAPALQYGAADCAFCHITASGGEGHNERGQWLIAERDRRGVELIDVTWLAAREGEVGTPATEPVVESPMPDRLPGARSVACRCQTAVRLLHRARRLAGVRRRLAPLTSTPPSARSRPPMSANCAWPGPGPRSTTIATRTFRAPNKAGGARQQGSGRVQGHAIDGRRQIVRPHGLFRRCCH